MTLLLAGLPFALGPSGAIREAERTLAASLDSAPDGAPDAWRVELVDAPPWEAPADLPDEAPAHVEGHAGTVRVAKRDFTAVVDPGAGRVLLHRTGSDATPLLITLKVALAARLPLAQGVALHAAAVARGGDALVFFGPSGAGKSTISELSPFPVLSDEMVALRRIADGLTVSATGFWGTLDRAEAPRGAFRVRALLALEKGPFALRRLAPAAAFRGLLGAALVPPSGALWEPAMRLLEGIAAEVPVARLAWDPGEPPWTRLEAAWKGRVGD